MEENFKKENVVEELQTLFDKVEEYKSEIDAYCDFMKKVFLTTSGLN